MRFYVFLIITILNQCFGSDETSQSKSSTADHKSIANVLNNRIKSHVTISRINNEFMYILRCENTEPVKWMCQNYTMLKQKSYIPQGNNMKFGITLTVLGSIAIKTNRCLCYKNSTTNETLAENELVSSIFVHELDDKNSVPNGCDFTLNCNFESKTKMDYPNRFKVKWILPKGVQWDESRMSQSNNNEYSNTLYIQNAVIKDSGDYTCQIVSYSLLSDRPVVGTQFKSIYAMAVKKLDDYNELVNKSNYDYSNFKANTQAAIGVCYSGYGLELTPNWYDPDDMRIFNNEKYYIYNGKDFSILFIHNIQLLDSGTYVASDRHLLYSEERYFNLTIEDVPSVRVENVFLRTNEKAFVQCIVQSYPEALVTWTFEPCSAWHLCSAEFIEILSNITSSQGLSNTEFIYNLNFKPISSGVIRCKAVNTIGTATGQGHIIIRDINDNMTIYGTMDNGVIHVGDSVTITCAVFTFYFSNYIHWYNANGQLINETQNIAISNSLNYYYFIKSLTFKRIKKSDGGRYECRGRLRNSTNTKSINYIIMPIDKTEPYWGVVTRYRTIWIAGISSLIALSFCLLAFLYIREKRKRKLLDELRAAGLANFEEGAVYQINSTLTFDEQADLLPYDRRFEFPRNKIKLGMLLGAGAFGVVYKAYAEGIMPNEKETVVAVNMVKSDAHNDVLKALVSELKIMVHLGKHLNVVNLLGAVTKNIYKRELMVIVEYCHYGNVRSFLLSNRERFINQIDRNTGYIDTTAIKNVANIHSECSNLSNSSMTESNLNKYQAQEIIELTNVSEDVDDSSFSNNYINPNPYCNFKTDSTYEIVITTADLISWAFQLASGMEYISSINVLHGDLAARNILLCKGFIVKICDFGLARSLYKCENYKKQGEALLPVKWLALESLSQHVFSTYSDVWSFGVVLWELFSLATVPYPNIYSYQKLYEMLESGYRMEKPQYANDQIYNIMLECWCSSPKERPLFNVLKEKFAAILGEEIVNHYLVMNEPYLKANTAYTNLKDYLPIIGSPDEISSLPSLSVNILKKDESINYYLPMGSRNNEAVFPSTYPKEAP